MVGSSRERVGDIRLYSLSWMFSQVLFIMSEFSCSSKSSCLAFQDIYHIFCGAYMCLVS